MDNIETLNMQEATPCEAMLIRHCMLLHVLLHFIGELEEFQQDGVHSDVWESMVKPILAQLCITGVPIGTEGSCGH